MADVSKLRLDNVTYDIKDDNARKYLVMVNEEPVSATKMVVTSSSDMIELATTDEVSSAINTEASARVNAISAEASARETAIAVEASTRANAISEEASTRATQVTSLQSQIDELVSPSGEAPSAAEVQNARIGADGITYSTLGNAIRTQVAKLNEDIIRLGWPYAVLSVIPSNTWAIQASGYSYIIPVSANDIIRIKNTKTTALYALLKSLSGISTSGASVDFASGFTTSRSLAKNANLSLTVPTDGKYLWIYGNDPGRTDDVYFPDTLIVNDIPITGTVVSAMNLLLDATKNTTGSFKSPIGTRIHFNSADVTNGYFVSASNGTLNANTDYRCTDYIPVSGKKVGISRGMAQFAFYDYTKNYVSGISVISGVHDYTEYDIPTNAAYVRFSFYSEQYADIRYVYCVFSDGANFPFDDWVIVSNNNLGRCPEFTTLRGGVEYAMQFKNAKILIRRGEYDLLTEFANEITNSQSTQFGLGVGNGIHIYGESGAVIKCLYSGTDQNVITNLSPFWAAKIDGGYALENIEVHSSNCRYCVHDEYAGAEVVVKNKYINCRFYHDDTGAGTLIGYYPQCIGGGCAKNTYADINGCYFYSKAAESTITPLVSYHNSSAVDSQNIINVNDSYFDGKGTFRCSYYGTTTLISKATLSNCSLGAAPIVTSEGGGSYPNNFSLLQYLNEIRS